MLYLTTPSGPDVRAAMTAGRIGCMTTPAQGNRIPDGAVFAADNGKFGKGWPGPEAWFLWLRDKVTSREADCLFAVAPDVPFDAVGTLAESAPWLPLIQALGIPAAFAAQNGSEHDLIPWDDFDVLFLAGDTAWKIGPVAERLSREAKDRGKRIHMGRVNSRQRLGIADWFGCDSADGTYVAFGPTKNLARVLGWTAEMERQPSLFGGAQ